MLDRAGKLLEKLLKFRLNAAMENAAGLTERPYGFRAGRSTIAAINEVFTTVNAVQSRYCFSRHIVLLEALDVRNAFNSLRWMDTFDALRTKFAVLGYLMRIMQSYLRDRELIYDTSQRRNTSRLVQLKDQFLVLTCGT